MASVIETCANYLLKCSIYVRRDSFMSWIIASSDAYGFGCRREAVKFLENIFPSCFQEVIDSAGRLLYQAMAPFLRVVRNNLYLVVPFTPR